MYLAFAWREIDIGYAGSVCYFFGGGACGSGAVHEGGGFGGGGFG